MKHQERSRKHRVRYRERFRKHRSVWKDILIISLVGFAIYSNTFNSAFHYDDYQNIVNNDLIKNLSNLRAIWSFSPTRFVTYVTFAMNYHIGGLEVTGYHVLNLIIHLLNGAIIYWISRFIVSTVYTRKENKDDYSTWIPLIAGLVFVSHPIQTQAVTYIVQRAASLATMFYLLSLMCYIKARLHHIAREGGRRSALYYSAAFISGILAMFSKEIAITLPLAIALVEFYFIQGASRIRWKYAFLFLPIVIIVPLTIYLTGAIDFQTLGQIETPEGTITIPPLNYLLTQFKVLVLYLQLVLVPIGQNLDHDIALAQTILEPKVLLSLALLVSILILAVFLFRRNKLLSFGIFWVFLTLLPESSIIPVTDVSMEHRLYLPMVGMSILIVAILFNILERLKPKNINLIIFALIGMYCVMTYARNNVYRDELSLWSDVVSKSPQKSRPYNNRGIGYLRKGMVSEAERDFRRATEIDPRSREGWNNLAVFYTDMGSYQKAIEILDQSAMVSPNSPIIFFNRGRAHYFLAEYEKAIEDYTRSLALDPKDKRVLQNRAVAFAFLARYQSALSDCDAALQLDPQDAEIMRNRTAILQLIK